MFLCHSTGVLKVNIVFRFYEFSVQKAVINQNRIVRENRASFHIELEFGTVFLEIIITIFSPYKITNDRNE